VGDIELGNRRRISAAVQTSTIPGSAARRQFCSNPPTRGCHTVPCTARKIEAPARRAMRRARYRQVILPPRLPEPAADDELRAILDTATDGIITLDAAGKIHTFSAGAEAIFGYRIAEVADKPFADLLAPESRKVLRDYLAALQGPGLASVFNDGREVTAVVKQGGTVPLFLTLGKCSAQVPGRFLRRGARHHPVEEDRDGIARGQGRGRSHQPAKIRVPRPHQP
jgi:PAS domain S-box-containing protein